MKIIHAIPAIGLLFSGVARCAAGPDAGLLDAVAVVGQQISGFKGSSIGQWIVGGASLDVAEFSAIVRFPAHVTLDS
jgi:hypothetical protein